VDRSVSLVGLARALRIAAWADPSAAAHACVADEADEAELDDIYETERRLLYVACTRAREHLLLTRVAPTSEYLGNFTSPSVPTR
jgi:ATP-dependent exoDNAse (exonuclease V) beta subunit